MGRRLFAIVLGALAFVALTLSASLLGGNASADDGTTTSTTAPPTTSPVIVTSPPQTVPPTAPTSAPAPTTTARPATTTTVASGGRSPVPPPASGPSQPLDPSLLGGTPIPTVAPAVDTATTLFFGYDSNNTTTTLTSPLSATAIVNKKDSPSGSTLVLASVAWLASLGGLLVYVEDKRGQGWKHLAR